MATTFEDRFKQILNSGNYLMGYNQDHPLL